jgi:cyclopropane fatty-acyl-phospholipid synthase-like methyltransferase
VSWSQLRRSSGRRVLGDIATIAFRPSTFRAVVALYTIPHVPREHHARLFRRVASWLEPGGWFLASLTAGDDPGWTGDWLGARMFFNGFDAATNRSLLHEAGFELVVDDLVTQRDVDGESTFQWVLARRA